MNVSAVARTKDTQDVFWVGADGSMYTSNWTRGWPWSGRKLLGGKFVPGTVVCAMSRRPDHLVLFAIDKDGIVRNGWWTQAGGWEGTGVSFGMVGKGFAPGTPMAGVCRTSDHMDLFATGADGRVYTATWGGGKGWSSHEADFALRPISQAFVPNSPVTTVSRGPQNLDLFIVGPDGRVYTSWWSEGKDWAGINASWPSLGGKFAPGTPITAISRDLGSVDLFATGEDGKVYTNQWTVTQDWYSRRNGNQWLEIGGSFAPKAKVAVVARTPDKLDILVADSAGCVYQNWWAKDVGWYSINEGAGSWIPVGGVFAPNAPLAATARGYEHKDVFYPDKDGRIYTAWWMPDHGWSSRGHGTWTDITSGPGAPPLEVTPPPPAPPAPPAPPKVPAPPKKKARIVATTLTVDQAQERSLFSNGDEPYVIMLGFRSRWGTPGSTRVFWPGVLQDLGHLKSGRSANIPASIGALTFDGVETMSAAHIAAGMNPEVFGAFAMVMESDNSSWGNVRSRIDQAAKDLSKRLVEVVEKKQVVADRAAPAAKLTANVYSTLGKAIDDIQAGFNGSVWNKMTSWLSGFGDPDDCIGSYTVILVGVDQQLGKSMGNDYTKRWTSYYSPRRQTVDVVGDGARYRLGLTVE
ncbi:hypothetical protein [Tessaracoccus caeni]|uniref:hypothetical protein n=1 Tax=Tessaracoccus caeni TaxID=3031239 RepID=UPI0023DBB1E3|nr:hypothetical protein [Tessaracoccus caeni]MDF1486840.1 hypothetical protein [Tessaracoccus caeni]